MNRKRKKTARPRRDLKAPAPLPEKLKARLYPAVLDLFAHNDFHQVNMREIYDKSGISPSTIYRYFPSKEDLLFAILDEKIGEIGALVPEQIRGLESTREIFRKIFWITMDYYDRNPGVAVTAFITVPMRTWMKEKSYVRLDAAAILNEVVEKGRERGELDPALGAGQIMDQYYMHCYRQIHQWYFRGMKRRLADGIPGFFEVFWKTVSAPGKDKLQ